jgi:hypothetical protein
MRSFFRKVFPERIFGRKLEPAAERRLRLAQARAEEAIVRAHVDTYIREMGIPEPLASTVATRTLVVLGQDLVPYRRRAVEAAEPAAPEQDRPKLRLDDASQGRQRAVKRAM